MSDSVTPWTVAHRAPLSMGFSRQEHWSGFASLKYVYSLWRKCSPKTVFPPGDLDLGSSFGLRGSSQITYGEHTASLFQVSPQMLPTQKSLPQHKREDILLLTSHPMLFFLIFFDTIKNSMFFFFACWFNACLPSAPPLPLECISHTCWNLCSLLYLYHIED